LLLLALNLVTTGCSSFQPRPLETVPFKERAQTQTRNGLTVTVAVPSVEEARALFGGKLDKQRVQPVWIQIDNHSDEMAWFPPIGVDRNYFPPMEVAWKSHSTGSSEANREIDLFFGESAIPSFVMPGESISGFVFTNLDLGRKLVPVELFQNSAPTEFEFVVEIPDFHADHTAVDFESLYDAAEWQDFQEKAELKNWVEALPCATANKDGSKSGDPVNFVLIEPRGAALIAFMRAGWDETELLNTGSALKLAGTAFKGGSYRNAPMSALYLFGRPQDVGMQKARWNVHQRNHLRLWLAPVTYRGDTVWVGQISRDIGTRLTTQSPTLTTHKIDPDVDDARDSLIFEMFYANSLLAFAAAKGCPAVPPESPRGNLTGDPWYTDGLRAVIFISREPVPYEDVDYIRWDLMP